MEEGWKRGARGVEEGENWWKRVERGVEWGGNEVEER